MGVFDSWFGKKNTGEKKEKTELPWIALSDRKQLDEIVEKSLTRPQLVFKHSTTCGVSRMVLNMFVQNHMAHSGDADFYFLDLHRYREVSNAVADTFAVSHQSPQLIVVKDGTVLAHSSHGAIVDMDLSRYV